MTDRAAFEQHFQLCIRQREQHRDGSYRDSSVQDKWLGWQARGDAKPLPANSVANPSWLFPQSLHQQAGYFNRQGFIEQSPMLGKFPKERP